MKKQFIIYGLIFLSSYQANSNMKSEELVENSSFNISSEFRPTEQRQDLLPNDLFIAVADKENKEILQKILDENGEYLLETNAEGDTPLGTAIQFDNLPGALFLAEKLNPKNFLHTNLKGEGYVYLAAKKGHVELIQWLAERYFKLNQLQKRGFYYKFFELDILTKSGERALHVAKNSQTATALYQEYKKISSLTRFPYEEFQLLQNNEGQTFLHTAVRDQNINLIHWGAHSHCLPLQSFWQGRLKKPSESLFNSKNGSMYFDNLIMNTTDNKKLSPFNASAKSLFLEGIQILSGCKEELDYLSKDEEGNIALQNFLLALDPLNENQDQNIKDVFSLLVLTHKHSKVMTWDDFWERLNYVKIAVNSVNLTGDSSLHISAKLADPFFYNQLKQYGNEAQKNAEGKTAKEIFKSKSK